MIMLCFISHLGTCPAETANAGKEIPPGYIYHDGPDKYYKPNNTALSFIEAQEQCRGEGGTLIEFRNEEERAVVDIMYSKLHLMNNNLFLSGRINTRPCF